MKSGPWAIVVATFTSLACNSEASRPIVRRWKYEASAPVAPAGLGPERRVLIALRSGGAELVTVSEDNGLKLEGPLSPVFSTERPPVAVGATLFVASSIGKIAAYALDGRLLFSAPAAPLGGVAGMRVAPDRSLRIASTSGRVLGMSSTDGAILFDAPIEGAPTSPPAVAPDGATFVATDQGVLVGFSADGVRILQVSVHAPASGPSTLGVEAVAVGELDAVRVFDRIGRERFRRPRAARVVGTRFLEDGDLLAWGEDGKVERLSPTGEPRFTFEAGPPIYADVVPLSSGGFAVIDSSGRAHRLDASGAELSSILLPSAPLPELSTGETGLVFAAVGQQIVALDFELDFK